MTGGASQSRGDPARVMALIDQGATRLDDLDRLLDQVTALYNDAEERWLEVYDTVAEALKDEMERQGRKGDPAEHWVETQARRENRMAYTNFRRSKRALEKVQVQVRATTAAMSGRQSELRGLQAEAGPGQYAPRPPEGQRYG